MLAENNPEIIVNLTAMLWFPRPRELASPLIYHARIYAAAIEKIRKKRGASISLQVVRKRKSSLVLTNSTTPFQPPIPMHDETPRAICSRQPPPITCFLHSHQICFSTRRFGYRTRGPSRKRNLVQACLWRSIGVRVLISMRLD